MKKRVNNRLFDCGDILSSNNVKSPKIISRESTHYLWSLSLQNEIVMNAESHY
jgi:hypothetical protein